MKICNVLGLDGAITYTFLARFTNILGSTGTVLLIVRFLNPAEQGYYYTLLSLVSLQMVFEMGFSFVIQQLAAHECVHVEIAENGTVSGDPVAHARLASALQLSLRWYTLASAAMGLILAPLGMIFFARHAGGTAPVDWLGPWLAAVCASMLGLWCTPFYSFIEGCGQVRAVASMRLRQAVVTSTLAWVPMLLHRGLYSPAMALVGYVGTGLLFIATRRRLLQGLLRHPVRDREISWYREVWPFQWRIAISSICGYFTIQVFIPIIFALRGPVEAGQMGMSISVSGYLGALALAWTSTKATPFGRMIARRQFQELDRLFLSTLCRSIGAFSVMGVMTGCFVALLPTYAPRLAGRLLSLHLLVLLILAAGANCIVQSLATLLRCFKAEPLLLQSLLVASLSIVLAILTASRWGNAGAVSSYLFVTAVVGLPMASAIFIHARRRYLASAVSSPCSLA